MTQDTNENASPGNAGQDAAAGLAWAGWVDQRKACGILGVNVGMFEYWTRHGQITTGR